MKTTAILRHRNWELTAKELLSALCLPSML